MSLRDRVGAKPMYRNITYREWIADAQNVARREEVVAFHRLALQEQVLPLVQSAITSAFQAYDANRWYRRLGRWLGRFWPGRRVASREEAVRILTEIERQRMKPLLTLEQHFPDGDADG